MENRANELEAFDIVRVQRDQIHGAPYNPRKIKDENAKNLKKVIKELGLLESPTLNKHSKEKGWAGDDIGRLTLVGGHQRIGRMDEILRRPDYLVTVHLVDLTPEEEVRANIVLNNPNLQGEWDQTLLQEIKITYPEMDFHKDFLFDNLDIQHIFAGAQDFDEIDSIFDPTPEQEDIVDMAEQARKIEKLKQEKKKERALRTAGEHNEGDYQAKDDNYVAHLVFENNAEKAEVFKKLRLNNDVNDSYIKASILYDIYDHKIHLRELS